MVEKWWDGDGAAGQDWLQFGWSQKERHEQTTNDELVMTREWMQEVTSLFCTLFRFRSSALWDASATAAARPCSIPRLSPWVWAYVCERSCVRARALPRESCWGPDAQHCHSGSVHIGNPRRKPWHIPLEIIHPPTLNLTPPPLVLPPPCLFSDLTQQAGAVRLVIRREREIRQQDWNQFVFSTKCLLL